MVKQYIIIPPVRDGKKYSVLKFNERNGKYEYLLSFGQLYKNDGSFYQHYKDTTPLKLWSDYDHNDKERKRLYFARFGKTKDKNSAKWWSNRFLWT